jgi:hypothetical protein
MQWRDGRGHPQEQHELMAFMQLSEIGGNPDSEIQANTWTQSCRRAQLARGIS